MRQDIRSTGARQYTLCYAVALLALGVTTVDAIFAAHPLWVRAVALLPGLVVAGWCLSRLLNAGHVDERSRIRWLYFIAGLHIVATLFFFPVQHLFDARPVVTADHAVHYAQCLRSDAVFWQTLHLDCYSPYFMAGYPAGTLFDLDMKGAELFTAILPLHTATALKLFILIAYLSMLPSVYRGSRMLGFDVEESILAVMLLLVFWHWGRPYAGDFRFVGMFSFVFATHAVIYMTGLVRRFIDGDRGRALFILGPIAFAVHVLGVVMAVVPMSVVLIADRARLTRRRAELLFLWALVVLFANGLWILPLIRFLPYKVPSEAYYQVHGVTDVVRLLWKPTGLIAGGILVLSLAGLVHLVRERRAHVAAPFAIASLEMLLFAAFGVYLPGLNQLEPGRFLFSTIVFATPLAGAGSVWLMRTVCDLFTAVTAARLRTAVLLVLALVPLPLSMLDAKAYYHHTLSVDLSPRVERLRTLLIGAMHGDGRLLIEEGTVRTYDGFFLPALLPSQTHVEQIGGPFPHVPLIFHRTSFDGTTLLGRPFAQWADAELVERLRFLRVEHGEWKRHKREHQEHRRS